MTESRRIDLREQLIALEAELKRQHLWGDTSPSAQALASAEPFCVDTLSLGEWIQWLMIPRIQAILNENQPLPENCNVLAIAEESFRGMGKDGRNVIRLIGRIDRLIADSP